MTFPASFDGLRFYKSNPPSYTYPLTTVSGAAVAYSFNRRLNGSYYGPAFRVSRSSDSTQLDIPFGQNGLLEANILKGFVGANTGYIVTIYDQSGNGRNLTNLGNNVIVNSGTLVTQGGFVAPSFSGSTPFATSGYQNVYTSGFTNIWAQQSTVLGYPIADPFGREESQFGCCCGGSNTASPFGIINNQPSVGNHFNQSSFYSTPLPYGGWDGANGVYADVAIDGSGNIYALSQSSGSVLVFNSSGVFQKTIGSQGTSAGQLYYPESICIDSNGYIYVAGGSSGSVSYITQYNSSGTYVQQIGSASGAGALGPVSWGIAVDSSNNLYVCDSSKYRVVKYTNSSNTFTYSTSVGSNGTGNGQFVYSSGIAVNKSTGAVYVGDQSIQYIQVFTSSLVYSSKFATTGATAKLCIDPTNSYIYWVEYNGYVTKYTTGGTVVVTASSQPATPQGACCDSSGNVYVAFNSAGISKYNSSLSSYTTYNGAIEPISQYAFWCNGSTKAAGFNYNNVANGSETSAYYTDTTLTPIYFGGSVYGNVGFPGYVFEVISYPSDIGSTNRGALYTNLKSFYGTP